MLTISTDNGCKTANVKSTAVFQKFIEFEAPPVFVLWEARRRTGRGLWSYQMTLPEVSQPNNRGSHLRQVLIFNVYSQNRKYVSLLYPCLFTLKVLALLI